VVDNSSLVTNVVTGDPLNGLAEEPRGRDDIAMMAPTLRPSRSVCDCGALRRKLASYSRVVQDLFGHEHVAHGDTPVELAKETRIGVLCQFAALSASSR
jgi:hypothetical protein